MFSCRVVHSSDAPLSAVEILNTSDSVVASAHTLSPNTFPERIAVEDQRKNIFLNKDEGERAMLIRGDKDWAVCTGRLRIMNPANRGRGRWKQYFGGKKLRQQHYVSIKVYNLFGARGWCSVRKSKGGLFLINFDSDTLVRIDLLKNRVVISSRAQHIPEILALACSISILYVLCMPIPQSHPSSTIVSPSLYTAGYLSKKVPRSNYQSAMDLVEQVLDFSEDISSEWIQWENATSDNVSDVIWMEKGVHVLARAMVLQEAVLEVKAVEDAWVEAMEVVTAEVDVEQVVAVVEVGVEVDVAAVEID